MPTLTNEERILIHEGLLIEYAPGLAVATDLASTVGLRANLLCPLMPRGAFPTTLSAAWIHTGWWPAGVRLKLCAMHPTLRHDAVCVRRELPTQHREAHGAWEIPIKERCALELLTMESMDVAVEGTLALARQGMSLPGLRELLRESKGMRHLPRAVKLARMIEDYLDSATRFEPVTR